MPPVGYQFGLSTIGSGNVPPVNAERFSSGGPNCDGMPKFGCCSCQYQPSYDERLVLIIGAQSCGWIGLCGSSTMSMQPSLAVATGRSVKVTFIAFMIIAPSGISPSRPLHSQSTTSGE